jgi:hypothetical protein
VLSLTISSINQQLSAKEGKAHETIKLLRNDGIVDACQSDGERSKPSAYSEANQRGFYHLASYQVGLEGKQ